MEKFVVTGGKSLKGKVALSGSKNSALKIPIAAILSSASLQVDNFPLITDGFCLVEMLESLGLEARLTGHSLFIKNSGLISHRVPLEVGARLRSSFLVLGPLLARLGKAQIPNPGGCRIGARPIDRQIEALELMGAQIKYNSQDGYFHATTRQLHGAKINFSKNTHTGTESVILAAVLAKGKTVLENAAEEIEIDELIACLNQMGAKIKRTDSRTIVIEGVKELQSTKFQISPDRSEEVTFAIAAAVTGGEITVTNSQRKNLGMFLVKFRQAGGIAEELDEGITRYGSGKLKATDIVTQPQPGFMTDWQAPWALMMTQASGNSTIHETVFENRFAYVDELVKMGAKINFFSPPVPHPEKFYNFNWQDKPLDNHQAIRIIGPTDLHEAVLTIADLRSGATLLLAALMAPGTSFIYGIEQIDRGYEKIDEKLAFLGAKIQRHKEEKL